MNITHLPCRVILRKNEERRILDGHPWVFSNEIRDVIGSPVIGQIVEAQDAGGHTLGIGFYNPHSLIAVRLLAPRIEEIDRAFFFRRISEALTLRQRLYPDASAYRLVHGESDYLPGLIVDRYDTHVSVQTLSYGMNEHLPMLCDILEELVHPEAIIERNDTSMRTIEGLPVVKRVLRGTPHVVTIQENGLRYQVDCVEGQKTGFFLDQRENRAVVGAWSRGLTVLDCFCNEGGFSLNAARGGASQVLGLDSSREAIAAAAANAALNRLDAPSFEQHDVFDALQEYQKEGRTFGMIVLDPPSFARNRKSVPAARHGYRDLHIRALRVLAPGGYLATASCSQHILPDAFLTDIQAAARKAEKTLQLLDWRGAPPDHPTLPGVPETRYLSFGLFRVYSR
jgi:23S rRNA (cytosine1962-C5)-methyltransferase